MKNIILDEITKNGIFINDQLLNDSEKKNLKKDFFVKKNYELFEINQIDEIKKISETLFNFLQRDYIKNFLREYFGSEIKCTNVLFSRIKPDLQE